MRVTLVVDVVARQLFAVAVPFTLEAVSRDHMVAVGFLALARVDRRGEMIQVEVPGPLVTGRISEVPVATLCTGA
jgi:TRAP-type C4-dicarboxylate transport system permease small subunit